MNWVLCIFLFLSIGGCLSKEPDPNSEKTSVPITRVKDLAENDPRVVSFGKQGNYFKDNNFVIVSWAEAQDLPVKGKLRGGKEYHTGWLLIVTDTGDSLLTKQPESGALVEFAKERSIHLEGFGAE